MISAQTPPQTVQDYYLSVPESYFRVGEDKLPFAGSREKRTKAIQTNDGKNGYLRLETEEWEGYGEVALFKEPQGGIVLGMVLTECAPGCRQSVTFLEYAPQTTEKWKNVTAAILPKLAKKALLEIYRVKKAKADEAYTEEDLPVLYVLPRYGTTVTVTVDPQFTASPIVLAELAWRNGKFIRAEDSTKQD